MKINVDDQEQIGVAAIDLFASGMGAFILIAIIFIILFSATAKRADFAMESESPELTPLECPEVEECPPPIECPEVEIAALPECPDVEETPCPECPELAKVEILDCPPPPDPDCSEVPDCPICPICEEVETVSVDAPIEEAPVEVLACPEPETKISLLPETDLVFVVDTTMSMMFEIEALKRELYVVVDVLERMMPSVAIGVVTFNDRLQRPSTRYHPVRQLTNEPDNLNDLQRFIRSISIHDAKGRNPDTPEALLPALRRAVATSFRANVENRVVIVITDAYAYESEQSATFQVAREFASTEGQRVSAVFLRTDPAAEDYLKRLTDAGNGIFVPDRGSILANVLLGLLPSRASS